MASYSAPTSFGGGLRRVREEKKLSLGHVAKKLGISVVYLSDVERGKRNPFSKDKIKQIASILEVDTNWLENLADKERKQVELDLEGRGPQAENAALALARSWNNISEQTAEKLLQIIEEKNATKGEN